MVAVRRNLLDSSAIFCSRCDTELGTFGDLSKSAVTKAINGKEFDNG
jgi:hypothetical protein